MAVTQLEDRATPALLFVVPFQGANGVSSFSSLQTALDHSQAGDVIQVEPGSTPGNGTILKSVTIQGDQTYGGATGLQASGTVVNIGGIDTPGINASNVILRNLYFRDIYIAPGVSGTAVTDSIIVGTLTQNFSESTTTAVVHGNSSIIGNTFQNSAQMNLGNTAGDSLNTASGDVIKNNVFQEGYSFIRDGYASAPITVSNETNLTITGNRIYTTVDGPSAPFYAAAVVLTDSSGTVSNNVIRATGTNWTGIVVQDNSAGDTRPVNVLLSGNAVTTTGAGIATKRMSVPNAFTVQVQNNSLAGSKTGVAATGNGYGGTNPFGTIQINGNDFRGYTGAGGRYAVTATNAAASSATLDATGNIFSVANPQTVVSVAGASGATINTANPITGGAADLTAKFLAVLAGPPTAAQHSALDNASAGDQANAAVRSLQAATALVDGLYVALLRRAPQGNENAGWVSLIVNYGFSVEAVVAGFTASDEYYTKYTQGSAYPDGAWLQSLYVNLLGRQAAPSELNNWFNYMRSGGTRADVTRLISQSAEFRSTQIRAYYGGVSMVVPAPNILKRKTPPTSAEVNNWLNLGYDLITVQAVMLAGSEFAMNG